MTRSTKDFAAALEAAHRALSEALRNLQDIAHGDAAASLAVLRARLGATHTLLVEHFRFEEQGGYMNTVREREPRLERTIEQLGSEHAALIAGLDRLVAQARTATQADAALRDGIRTWIDSVRAHETRENSLVQDAFNRDFQAED